MYNCKWPYVYNLDFVQLALQRLVAATCPIWPDLSTSTMSPVDMASASKLAEQILYISLHNIVF